MNGEQTGQDFQEKNSFAIFPIQYSKLNSMNSVIWKSVGKPCSSYYI